ncbi:GL22371 [Drosophila persimilis]|uniref:GL22371 n=1 Tax=Drosophila persimilis TaxID=7234 RepID=B4IRH7_DROPE|nr:GL22371 [Drosophila persimilis]
MGVTTASADESHHGSWLAMSTNSEMFALHTKRIQIRAKMFLQHFMATSYRPRTLPAKSWAVWGPTTAASSTPHGYVPYPRVCCNIPSHAHIQRQLAAQNA